MTVPGSTLQTGANYVSATFSSSSTYPASTSTIATVTIVPPPVAQAQTITFTNTGTQTYGVAPIPLNATASSELVVSYSVAGPASVTGSTLTITGAGSVTVTANQAGNGNYAAAPSVPQNFTVNPAALTATANSTALPYGQPIPALTGTLTGVVAGDGITASYTTTAAQGSAAGSYPITPVLNDPNAKLSNYSVTKTNGTLTITASTAAQATPPPPVDFGTVTNGETSAASTLTFTFNSGATISSPVALTLGAAKLDFAVASGGTCTAGTYSTGATCTVNVTFTPTVAGGRSGAVLLQDGSGNTIATAYVHGIGSGPQVAFPPAIITTDAGNGSPNCAQQNIGNLWSAWIGCYGGDGGPATSAELFSPGGVAFDGAGNLYIADTQNYRVRKVTPGGTITTVAGNGIAAGPFSGLYSGDGGPAISAGLNVLNSVAVDGAGNLYIADGPRIRKVTPGGTITTVAGNGQGICNPDGTGNDCYSGDGGPATSAELFGPQGVAVDGAGNLYIADTYNSRIRMVTPGGTITTVAGIGSCTSNGEPYTCYSGDGGPATSAQLFDPSGVAFDGSGNLYFSDSNNDVVRKVTPGGTISTVAGKGWADYTASGDGGPATKAGLYGPQGVAVDAAGNLYIADSSNDLIRKVTPGGTISTVAGTLAEEWGWYSGDGGPAIGAGLFYPAGIAVDGAGNLYIADEFNNRVRKVDVSDAPSLTFASTNYGQASAAQDVTVLNLGNAPLNISQISTAANFSLGGSATTCSSGSLASAASCVLGIEFTPTEGGSISGSVVLTDNVLNSTSAMQTITLQGTGNDTPAISLSATSLAFGNALVSTPQTVANETAAQTVTLTNTGTGPMTITNIALTGTNNASFLTSNTCPASLAAGANCAIRLRFYPQAVGSASAALTITDNASASPQSVALSGTGTNAVASVSTTSLAFGPQMLNTATAAQTVTLTNTGTGPLTIASIAPTGASSASFVVTSNTCPASLAAGANCAIGVSFDPQATGPASAALTINDNAATSPQGVALSGTGGNAAPSLSVTSLAFGDEAVSTPQTIANESAVQTVTLTNTGAGPLTITNTALTGTNNASFLTSNTCPASLAANGGSCAIRIRFYPQAVGAASAALTIADNALTPTQSVALSGTGTNVAASLSATNLAFGDEAVSAPQTVANESAAQTVTLTNTGTGPMTITNIALPGTNSASFVTSNTCPASLAAGANCAIRIRFYPQAVGSASAALTITDNAVPPTQSVALSGTGTNVVASLSATNLAFGNALVSTPQTVANETAAQTVTLTNTGTGPMTITNIALTGTNNASFLTSNTCPASLAAGANCAIRLRFYPQAVGSASAALTITDNAVASPQSIALTGSGQ